MNRDIAVAQDAKRPIADFVSVAIGAMENATAPLFGQPLHRWKPIAHSVGEEQSPRRDRALRLKSKATIPDDDAFGTRRAELHILVLCQLFARGSKDLERGASILAEEAVRVFGKSISRLAIVDDEHRSPCASELHRRR